MVLLQVLISTPFPQVTDDIWVCRLFCFDSRNSPHLPYTSLQLQWHQFLMLLFPFTSGLTKCDHKITLPLVKCSTSSMSYYMLDNVLSMALRTSTTEPHFRQLYFLSSTIYAAQNQTTLKSLQPCSGKQEANTVTTCAKERFDHPTLGIQLRQRRRSAQQKQKITINSRSRGEGKAALKHQICAFSRELFS